MRRAVMAGAQYGRDSSRTAFRFVYPNVTIDTLWRIWPELGEYESKVLNAAAVDRAQLTLVIWIWGRSRTYDQQRAKRTG